MNRQDIEQLNPVRPFCFETEREEEWYNAGLIDGLEVADNESPWVSVDDRLPDLDENEPPFSKTVYLTNKEGRVDYGYYDYDKKRWRSIPLMMYLKNDKVTHWMPIPPLVGGEESKNM